jgi:hypothetical protein
MPLPYAPCHNEKYQKICRHEGQDKNIFLQCAGIEKGMELSNK